MLEHKGIRWGYVFLKSANHLKAEHFEDLMVQAVEMYLEGEETREVKHADFQGRLFTEKRYEVIGTLGGQRFDAELETAYGRDEASFLVNEQTAGLASAISKN